MNGSLTPELENFVQKEVSSGRYHNASEVIRAGLRRLKEDQHRRLPGLPQTESQLLQSIEALENGEGVNGEDVLRRLRERIVGTRTGG